MLNVGLILKTISAPPNSETPTAAFLNWLAYSCVADQLLTPDLVNAFFLECLDYPHWQQNRRALSEEVRHLLESACLHLEEVFEFAEINWPTQTQVVELEYLTDWVDAVNSYLVVQHKGGDKFRIVHDDVLQRLLAIILHPNGTLSVREFTRKFFIRNGALTPLREDLQIHFDDNFELLQEQSQKLSLGNFISARFSCNEGGLFGTMARGYSFQRYQAMEGQDITAYSKLFYTIQRIEQHFLKRDSDPFYQEIIANIEHAIRMIRIGDEEFIAKAPDIMSQGQNAIDYVFIGDKLLSLLIRDLQHTMAGRQRPGVETTAVRQKDDPAKDLLKPSVVRTRPGLSESPVRTTPPVSRIADDVDLIELSRPLTSEQISARDAGKTMSYRGPAKPEPARESAKEEDSWSQQSLTQALAKNRWSDLTN